MGRKKKGRSVDREIVDYLLSEVSAVDRDSIGAAMVDWSFSTVNKYVGEMAKAGVLQEGVSVTTQLKKSFIKSYVLIETSYGGPRQTDGVEIPYQQQLVKLIRDKIKTKHYRKILFLESVDIVLGTDFDIILILLARDPKPIGVFVTEFLKTHRDVAQTITINVNPSDQTKLPDIQSIFSEQDLLHDEAPDSLDQADPGEIIIQGS